MNYRDYLRSKFRSAGRVITNAVKKAASNDVVLFPVKLAAGAFDILSMPPRLFVHCMKVCHKRNETIAGKIRSAAFDTFVNTFGPLIYLVIAPAMPIDTPHKTLLAVMWYANTFMVAPLAGLGESWKFAPFPASRAISAFKQQQQKSFG